MDYELTLEDVEVQAASALSHLLHVQLEGIKGKLFKTIAKRRERDRRLAFDKSIGRVNAKLYAYVLDVEVAAARLSTRRVKGFDDGRRHLVVRVERGVKARV
jgi:hypothetical protein